MNSLNRLTIFITLSIFIICTIEIIHINKFVQNPKKRAPLYFLVHSLYEIEAYFLSLKDLLL